MTTAIDTERWARAWLSRVVEPGQRVVAELIDAVGPVELVHKIRAGDVPSALRRATTVRSLDDRVEVDLALAAEHDVRLLIPGDPDWPDLALHPCVVATAARKPDLAPPIALWVRGRSDLIPLFERAVAVIGARAATPYGEHCATDLAFGLAERGWTVVSGGAYGIDRAAHRGAVAAGGPTAAFLASGLDAPYPRGNTALFRQIAEAGALISEWPVGTTPQRLRFLARNRLIAAVSAGTVVVEAAARSGTSNTANQADKLGRVVMAVPGATTSAMSVGTHHLIREKDARLVTRVDEVLEDIGRFGDDLAPPRRAPARKRDLLDPLARQVLEGLPARGSATPEEIAAQAAVLPGDVLRALPVLELEDLVERRADGWSLRRGAR
jgi:DNA processing protein